MTTTYTEDYTQFERIGPIRRSKEDLVNDSQRLQYLSEQGNHSWCRRREEDEAEQVDTSSRKPSVYLRRQLGMFFSIVSFQNKCASDLAGGYAGTRLKLSVPGDK